MLPVGLKRTTAGALSVSFLAAQNNYSGIGVDVNGDTVLNNGPPDFFPNGTPIAAITQGLCIVDFFTLTPPVTRQNGFTVDANKRIPIVNSGGATAPLQEQNGYIFDANGSLLTT